MLSVALAAAAASPVYLTCELPRPDGPLKVEVTVDEAAQEVTVFLPATGFVETRRAVFSPTEVRVPGAPSAWRISRVDLSITRTFDFMPATDPGESGTCRVAPPPARRVF